MTNTWFDVDKKGLAKLLEQRGKAFAVYELVQNSWDAEGVTRVDVCISETSTRGICDLLVMDDAPKGFADLSSAHTLFAESEKKGLAEKRGWMNLGEKLVLALCESASIATTTGTTHFNKDGTRSNGRIKTDAGTEFNGRLRMTKQELPGVLEQLQRLIPPDGILTYINGDLLKPRTPIAVVQTSLATRVADVDGVMVKAMRTTKVALHEVLNGETASIYEMGIPVVETGDKYHVDIQQKVPLNTDRDNVPPAYLRNIRTLVLNTMPDRLTAEDVAKPWVREAASQPGCSDIAIKRVIDLRYGENRVAADPSDREAEGTAKANGYAVIHGGSLTAGEWENAKAAGVIKPAGQAFPTPKPFSEGGRPLKLLENPRPEHLAYVAFVRKVGFLLLEKHISVVLANDSSWGFRGSFGDSTMHINVVKFNKNSFFTPASIESIDFICHELAHHYGGHLDATYHEALSRFAGVLTSKALREPGFFSK